MTDPQTAADAAECVQAFLDGRTAYRQSLGPSNVAYLTDEIARQVTDATPSTAYNWYGDVRILREGDLIALLADRTRMAAELERRGRLLGIGIEHEEWDTIAETEGRRYEGEQTDDTIVGYLAYSRENARIARDTQRARAEDMAAELEQVRGERDALQRPYDGCEGDGPHVCNGGGIMSCSICGKYTPDAEAQKSFQTAAAADMERARRTGVLAEIEAWEDAETTATRPADGKRTPEQWCAEYGIDIRDPDGWRGRNDPPWDEPITLPDFLRRAARSTCRGLTPDVWNRLSREAHEAADAERSDAEGAGKGPESPTSVARDATERCAAQEGSVS